jgi:hypothetical protein
MAKQRWYDGETMMAWWWNNDGTMIKQWWYEGQTMMARWWNNDGTMVKQWYDGETTMVLWHNGETTMVRWWNRDITSCFRPFSMHTTGPTIGLIPNANFDFFPQISKNISQFKVEHSMLNGLHNPGAWCYSLYSTFRDGTGWDLSVTFQFYSVSGRKNFAKLQILFK